MDKKPIIVNEPSKQAQEQVAYLLSAANKRRGRTVYEKEPVAANQ